MPTVYIVNETVMDPARVDLPAYIEWSDSGLGYGRRAALLRTNGVMIEDGIAAVLSAYPDAQVTADSHQAFLWLQQPALHGGVRPGAGRPALSDELTVETTITLPQSLAAKALRIGDGNRSAGVRKALEAFNE